MAERYTTAESLTGAPLIFDDSVDFLRPRFDWPAWFRAMGIDYEPKHGTHFSNADHAVNAAISGAGIVLGRRA